VVLIGRWNWWPSRLSEVAPDTSNYLSSAV
jgi:hypothetical protein